jgi:hypothetical protein
MKDPDSLTYSEAMTGEDREPFEDAMANEISDLEKHKTWTTILRSDVPSDAKVLPSTWVFKIKHYPDGRK